MLSARMVAALARSPQGYSSSVKPQPPQVRWIAGDSATIEFRIVRPADEELLSDLFNALDVTHFRPHPLTPQEAHRIAHYSGRDCYSMLVLTGKQPLGLAYGILRGWDDGYSVPSLGIAVRQSAQGQGFGRQMMECLHSYARAERSTRVRLRVAESNTRARRLYQSLGYVEIGEERGEILMILDL